MAFLVFADRTAPARASPNSCMHEHIGENHKGFPVLVYVWWEKIRMQTV